MENINFLYELSDPDFLGMLEFARVSNHPEHAQKTWRKIRAIEQLLFNSGVNLQANKKIDDSDEWLVFLTFLCEHNNVDIKGATYYEEEFDLYNFMHSLSRESTQQKKQEDTEFNDEFAEIINEINKTTS